MITLLAHLPRPVAEELCELFADAHPDMNFRVAGWDGDAARPDFHEFAHRLGVACSVEFTPLDSGAEAPQRKALRTMAAALAVTIRDRQEAHARAVALELGYRLVPTTKGKS